jgi:CubicO group peptidase (beta-lactamase class C family)
MPRSIPAAALSSYLLLLPLLAVVSCAASRPEVPAAARSATDTRSGPWLQYADVRQAGFDGPALRAVCERADSLKSGAVMAVFRGRVILACGDVVRKFEAHSVRKSLVSALYGTAVARREINLDSTLADFSIEERTPLTAAEQSATIRQVISARSGVYLPAAYGASQERGRPARGSHLPGTHWFYNNWDFNIAGVVYEQATREDLYESFDRRLAKPLGMEDWKPADSFRVYEPTKSRHPAHTFRISTRDLARFGQLYLQEGQWAGRQILSADWVTESTRPHTDDGDGTGYGYMWWTYQAGSVFTAKYPMLGKYTFYRALGTGEQGVWVIPGAELVVVHRADTDHRRNVDGQDHWRLVESILGARRNELTPTPTAPPKPKLDLRPVQSTVLSSQLPPAIIPEYRALPESVLDDYPGDYELGPGATNIGGYKLTPGAPVRVFLFDEKPYVHLPGVVDVQMFPTVGRDTFTVRATPGMAIAFERGAGDEVTAVTLTLGDDTLKARVFR